MIINTIIIVIQEWNIDDGIIRFDTRNNLSHNSEEINQQQYCIDRFRVGLRSIKTQRFLTAEPSGVVVANRAVLDAWEVWDMEFRGNGSIALRSTHGKYLCLEPTDNVSAKCGIANENILWVVEIDPISVMLVSPNHRYLSVEQANGQVSTRQESSGLFPKFIPVNLASQVRRCFSWRQMSLSWFFYSAQNTFFFVALLFL